MESSIFFFDIIIGTIDFILAIGFIYYAAKNAVKLKGAVTQYLMVTGALFFVISGITSAMGFLIFHTILIMRYTLFIVGFILISIGEIYSIIIIRKVVGKKPWLTMARVFSHNSYRSGGILVILLFTIPVWTLSIITGPLSIYGVVALLFAMLSFVLLIIGERKFYATTNVVFDAATVMDGREISLLRDDIAAVRIYTDIINTFLYFGKPAMSAMVVNDALNKWSEDHPVLFENCLIRREGKIDTRVVIQNLDRMYEKNRLSMVLKEFSTLTTHLITLYGGFTSSKYTKERLAESYKIVRKKYGYIPIIFDILRTMPEDILEEEKLGLLNRGELEAKVKERTAELVESKEFAEKLIASTKDGFSILDRYGVHIDANKALCQMTGFSREELVGTRPPHLYWPEEEYENIEKTFQKTLRGEFEDFELIFKRKNGERFPVIVSPSQVTDEGGNVISYFATVKDITERKKAEEELKKYQRKIELQNIQLRKLDQLKSDFLNVTSHELRTPMAAMKGYIQMLLKQILGDITEEQKGGLEVVLRNTNRLDYLIQEILDISQLESGTMKFILEKADVGKMVTESIETMQPAADLKNIRINADAKDRIPELVVDQERVKQVLINLLDNAIKFSPNGSSVNVCTKRHDDDVLFEIQDFGRGIPKVHQEKIFNTFYQVNSGADRKFGGTGLGLAISQSIILAHGGKIWVESEGKPGKGSTFKFTLPVKSVKDIESRIKDVDVFGLKITDRNRI